MSAPLQTMTDSAVLEPSRAYLYYAPVGSPAPTKAILDAFDPGAPDNLGTGMSAWSHLGHTDLDEDFEADEDGGDSETRGSRQNPNLRERVEATTEYLQVNPIEFKDATAKLYYGGGTAHAEGEFDSTDTPSARDYAIFIAYVDGEERRVGEYHPKASVRRNGPAARAADGFMRFPLRFTWLKLAGAPVTRWIGEHFGADFDEA